jgi:ribulose-phosphate 3-epimerase
MATDPTPKIVPSVLPANFARLGEDCRELEKAGVDRIQWDVMDGHFVPNLTFGPDVVAAGRREVEVPFEAHLMVSDPDALVERFVEAGCSCVIVHAEACLHLHRTLSHIEASGARAGVALNPGTPLEAVTHVLDLTSLLLVMTVNPGFGGQKYIATMEPKIAAARETLNGLDHEVELEVDGGIGPATIGNAAAAGADVFCAGSALFKYEEGLEAGVTGLRQRAADAASTDRAPGR